MTTTQNTQTQLTFGGSYAVDEIGAVSGEHIMEFAICVTEGDVTYRFVGTFDVQGRSLDFCYRLARRYMALTRATLLAFGTYYTTFEFPRVADFNLWSERVSA